MQSVGLANTRISTGYAQKIFPITGQGEEGVDPGGPERKGNPKPKHEKGRSRSAAHDDGACPKSGLGIATVLERPCFSSKGKGREGIKLWGVCIVYTLGSKTKKERPNQATLLLESDQRNSETKQCYWSTVKDWTLGVLH